ARERVQERARDEVPPSPLARIGKLTLRLGVTAGVALIFCCVLVDSYNLNLTERLQTEPLEEPPWMRAILQIPQLVHDWGFFAPNPMKDDGWWVVEGVTKSGQPFDPLTGKPPVWEKPADLSVRYDCAWRTYLYRIWLTDYADHRPYFAKYVTYKNHREQPEGQRLARFKLYYVKEWTQPPGTPEPFSTERILLWEHDCIAK